MTLKIMKNNFILILLVFFQTIVFAQDKKVMKIAKYIEKGKGTEAKELLDELDSKKEYQSDIYYWYVRTVYYRNIAVTKANSTSELAEARKSFEKLVEFDKTDPSKSFTQYIPQIRKDLYEGKNQSSKSTGSSSSFSQAKDNGTSVTLTVVGQGQEKEEAKINAFRSAIEQAFGVYISSNTQIVNDKLIKDEIISITNGNIQSFKIVSEGINENNRYSLVMIAAVSVDKLISFCEAKGISVEYKGALFAANVKLQQINIKNEEKATEVILALAKTIIKKGCWNYKINAEEPQSASSNNELWRVPIKIEARYNGNLNALKNSISEISMTQQEINFFKSHNMDYYQLEGTNYNLRSKWSACTLIYIFDRLMVDNVLSFYLSNNSFEKYDFSSLSLSKDQKANFSLLSKNNTKASFSNYYLNVGGSSYMSFRNQNHYLSDKKESDYNNIVSYYNNYYFPQIFFYYCNTGFQFNFYQIFNTESLSKISEFRIEPKTITN